MPRETQRRNPNRPGRLRQNPAARPGVNRRRRRGGRANQAGARRPADYNVQLARRPTGQPRARPGGERGARAGRQVPEPSTGPAEAIAGLAQPYIGDFANPLAVSRRFSLDLDSIPYDWARKELTIDQDCRRGEEGELVWRIQEWLSLHGVGTTLDGVFGSATEAAVRAFQQDNDLEATGFVDANTFGALVSPMARALGPIGADASHGELAAMYAEQHLAEHPREVGGQNSGPWVRLYMDGNDGEDFAWCAGFASFVHRQAADTLEGQMPFEPSFSCDVLARNGCSRGDFVTSADFASGAVSPVDLPVGSLFLTRRTADDWNHTGVVVRFDDDSIQTIEGNTNDDGVREGYEVCRRVRAYDNCDFLLV